MKNSLITFTFTWLSTEGHKPDTQHEREMVLQEWQHYMCRCPTSLVLLQFLLLPGHFSAFITRLQRAVTYGHTDVTLERREGGGIRWCGTGGLTPGHIRRSSKATRSGKGSGWAHCPFISVGEADRGCPQVVADLLTALTALPFTHPTPKPAVTILLYWV